jgi:peptidase M48-like protein
VTELRRLELALAVLGGTVAALAVVIALDAIRYHGLDLFDGHPHGVVLIALVIVDGLVIARALASLVRQLRASRAFLRRLPVREAVVHGRRVRVFPGRLGAFCAGLLRPAVYVSEGTLQSTEPDALQAILAHEERHRLRRDPLRLLLARMVSDAIRPLPPFAVLAERQAAIADLVADAAAVDALGDATPLAAALVHFDERGAGVAPERVDRLAGTGPAETVSPALLLAAAGALAGIAALLAPMLLLHWHPDLTLPASIEPAVLIAVCVPACLAARRADRCLRTSA